MTYQSKGFVETRRDLETTEDEISAGSIVANTSVREFPITPGSSEFNRGLNVKFQGKGKFVVEHVK